MPHQRDHRQTRLTGRNVSGGGEAFDLFYVVKVGNGGKKPLKSCQNSWCMAPNFKCTNKLLSLDYRLDSKSYIVIIIVKEECSIRRKKVSQFATISVKYITIEEVEVIYAPPLTVVVQVASYTDFSYYCTGCLTSN